MIGFYNFCLGINDPYSRELKPLIKIYMNSKYELSHLPPLTQTELNEIMNKTSIPEDIHRIIGEYLNIQQAGRKTKQKHKKHNKTKRIKPKRLT